MATISLRLRPVCSFAPSGPSFSISAVSAKWCTSSAFEPSSHAGSDLRARLDFIERGERSAAHSSMRQNARRSNRARPRAVERKLLRQQAAVELPRTLELVERCVGRALEPPAPHFLFVVLFGSAAGSLCDFRLPAAR